MVLGRVKAAKALTFSSWAQWKHGGDSCISDPFLLGFLMSSLADSLWAHSGKKEDRGRGTGHRGGVGVTVELCVGDLSAETICISNKGCPPP